MDLTKTMKLSAAGMAAQEARMRAIAENLANADSLGQSPDADPYRRKVVTFTNVLDRELQARRVKVDRVGVDSSEFERRYDPNHPAADAQGYVRRPNVNTLIEMMDMRQSQRSYEANLSAVEIAKSMLARTIDILRG